MTSPVTERPEIVIGIAAAVGTPLRLFLSNLKESLEIHGYSCEELHLSLYTRSFKLNSDFPDEADDEFSRVMISNNNQGEFR
jgi:hypothetical protein